MMKRFLLLFVIAILLALPSAAQTQKGWRSVGGTGIMHIGFKTHSFSFGISPEVYWFVAEDFAFGTDFGIGFGSSKPNDTTSSSGYSAFVAPGVRYYFRDVEKKFRPYCFLNVGAEAYANKYKSGAITSRIDGSGIIGYAGVGLAWFFTEHAAFDIRLHIVDYASEQATVNPTFTIGIQAFFD